jgi:uncharacterized protein with PQ loop repeat
LLPHRRLDREGTTDVDALEFLPLTAAVLAVPQFLPQLAAIRRSGDTAGVSWSWAALTSASNAGWFVYFVVSGYHTALVPAASATIFAGALAVLIARRGGVRRAAAATVVAWALLLVAAGLVAGGTGLGTALTVSFAIQVTPSVWTAYRTDEPTGISRGTWLLILAELLCWGVYGAHESDVQLTVLGAIGVVAATLMLVRAAPRAQRRARTPARMS